MKSAPVRARLPAPNFVKPFAQILPLKVAVPPPTKTSASPELAEPPNEFCAASPKIRLEEIVGATPAAALRTKPPMVPLEMLCTLSVPPLTFDAVDNA